MEKQQEACQMLIIRKTVEENGIRFADIQITYPRLLQKETAATEEKQTKKNAGKRVRRVSERKECTETLNAHFSSVAGNFYKYCTEQLAENERSRYGQMTEPNKRFLYRGIKAGMFFELNIFDELMSIKITATVTRGAQIEGYFRNAEVWDLREGCLVPASEVFGNKWKKLRAKIKTDSGVLPSDSSWYLTGSQEAVVFTNVFGRSNRNGGGRRQQTVFEQKIELNAPVKGISHSVSDRIEKNRHA